MKLRHAELTDLLQRAYSAEKAAGFAYQGHAGSLRDSEEIKAVRQIENDEWNHRAQVLEIMHCYNIPVSRRYERRFYLIGKIISGSCYVIGRFMPFYFAGRLESGNVCEYFRMKQFFNAEGIYEHDEMLYEMGMKEKEHEVYFLEKVKSSRMLTFFERLFSWGKKHSYNNIDLERKYPVEFSDFYCRKPTSTPEVLQTKKAENEPG